MFKQDNNTNYDARIVKNDMIIFTINEVKVMFILLIQVIKQMLKTKLF